MTVSSGRTNQDAFADLPAALVEEVIGETSAVAHGLLESFQKVKDERRNLREDLDQSGLIINEGSLGTPPAPTTCAADGSYGIDRLLTMDLAASAAVAVEGLTPPSETRHWELPTHRCFVVAEPHTEDTATVLRAVMVGHELELLSAAPHELLMLDGTFTLPLIYFNQALSKAPDAKQLNSSREFLSNCTDYLESYLKVVRSERSDKQFIALPKYSTRREIGTALGWPESYDDRGMLTMLLNPGELTNHKPLEQPTDSEGSSTWHLNTRRLPPEQKARVADLAEEIIAELEKLRVIYYKPQDWLPALRLEVSEAIATNRHRMATLIQGIKHQTGTPSMLEPYPIYLADRTVKALSRALPAFRQVTTQRIAERYDGDIGEVFFAMHGYRSESGR